MDLADLTGFGLFLLIGFGLPLIGYGLMIIDLRLYLRALRRALVVVTQYAAGHPEWVVQHVPPALQALGLCETSTEEDVREAYRQLAERCHPDRGGSPQAFHKLRRHYDEALAFVRRRREPDASYSSLNSSR